MWQLVPKGDLQEAGIPCNEPLLGYSAEWVDPDFNPGGIRECFIGGEGTWVSAKWFDYQDTYINGLSAPTHWMLLPEAPTAAECGAEQVQPITALCCEGKAPHAGNTGMSA